MSIRENRNEIVLHSLQTETKPRDYELARTQQWQEETSKSLSLGGSNCFLLVPSFLVLLINLPGIIGST
jgi:hypothetical protein